MTTPVGGGSNSEMIHGAAQRLAPKMAELKEKAGDQDDLLGISVFGLGIPNEMFGFDLRTPGQKAAQAAPADYAQQMYDLLKMLKDAQDGAYDAASAHSKLSTTSATSTGI